MELASLPLPGQLIQTYHERGFTELYPPQAECVNKGLFAGKNLLISIPTASGKTLVAEMAMHSHIASGGKCLYIVPLRALAREKYDEFSGKGVVVSASTGDFDRKEAHLKASDIIVATSEKVDSLLRNGAPWMNDISLLVVDEVHLLDSERRGATLEMVITKIRDANPSMQIIALSATIGNPGEIAQWLDAECVTGDWRPIELCEGVYCRPEIHFQDSLRVIETPTGDDDINLCMDTLKEGGQCLVFVNSRRNAEGFAKRAARALDLHSPALLKVAKSLSTFSDTDIDRTLAAFAGRGAAFHHAGLRHEQRHIIEEGFRRGAIQVISSTPTLAAGLNLPARRVVIRDYLRYEAGSGMRPIPVREYHQMAGRAGRPHLDPYGEAVLIAKTPQAADELREWYIDSPPEKINSKIGSDFTINAQILSLIDSGFVHNRQDLVNFMGMTLYAFQEGGVSTLTDLMSGGLSFLEASGMIASGGDSESSVEGGAAFQVAPSLSTTHFGSLVSRLYIDPRGADMIWKSLHEACEYSHIAMLHMLCCTPDMPALYIRRRDGYRLDQFLFDSGDALWFEPPVYGSDEDLENFFRGLKTALLMADWIDEVPEEIICERYGVGPGDIYHTTESMQWLLHAARRLASLSRSPHQRTIHDLAVRVRHGVKDELLDLVRLPGIGRVRARRLFTNGLCDPDALRAAGRRRLGEILGKGIAKSIWESLGGKRDHTSGERDPPDRTGSGQSTLQKFG